VTGAGRRLDRRRLSAILRRLDPGARLLVHRPLEGGMSATMEQLDVERADGRRERLVLRLPGPENLKADPLAGIHEYRLLGHLAEHGVPAPRPRLLDDTRSTVPFDALLLDWTEGEVDFAPADPVAAAEAMASVAASVHEVPVEGLSFLARTDDPLVHQDNLVAQHPARLDGATTRRLAEAWRGRSAVAPVLLHGDLWPGNMLWRDGRLVAALDWEDAATGDPLSDLGIARLDLAIFFGAAAMAAFTTRYAAETGRDLSALPFWDLHACQRTPADYDGWDQGWEKMGRPDITAGTMAAARAEVLQAALVALG